MRELVGPYRILEVIGRGGMGVVYRGLHDNLGRKVAIKALAPELTQDPQFRERFFSEARTQAQLQHPNIVTIYDLLEDGGEYFIVMEHVAGRGLDDIMTERGATGLPEAEALGLFSQVLLALDSAHSEGVIHRDVKSSNVLVNDRGQVKLMDFGIALLIGDKRLTQSSQTIGTPVYMSPEQILRPREVDHRTDIYSAGILLFEMLSGRPPFDAETEYEIKKLHIEAAPVDVGSVATSTTPELSKVISRALSKDPGERFPSAGEFLRCLRAAAPLSLPSPETAPAEIPRLAEPVGTRRADDAAPGATRQRVLWAGAAAALIAVVGAVVLFSGLFSASMPREADSSASSAAVSLSIPEDRSATAPAPEAPSGQQPPTAVHRPPEVSSPSRASTPTVTAPRVDEKPPPPREKPKPPPPRRNVEAEIHKKSVAKVRQQIQAGLAQIEASIAQEEFSSAQSKLQELTGLSSRYRSELVDEIVALRLLGDKITDAIVAQRARESDRVAQRAAWERRIEEIRQLIASKKFPEAKQLARNLQAEDGVPEDITQQAGGLIVTADEEFKKIFANTEWKEEAIEVEGETKKDKKRRNKEKDNQG